MDSDFNRASLILVGSVVRIKRRYAAAKGCSARLSCWFRAGTDARAGAVTSKPGVVQARASTVVVTR